MKKYLFSIFALISISLSCKAQIPELVDDDDADDIESLADILSVTGSNMLDKNDEEIKRKSWKRKTFFRISYNKTDFSAQSDGLASTFKEGTSLKLDGVNKDIYNFKNAENKAVSIQWGRNIGLHKKAIANTVQFALDYTWIDLNWNNYEASYSAADNGIKYNSSESYQTEDSKTRSYLPWGVEKNEINYGMSLGPSLTIAPFGALKNKGLMCIHLQAYYHFGYSASAVLLNEKKEFDAAGKTDTSMDIVWGHGYNTSYGFNLSWKAIGIGMEKRTWKKIKYKSIDSDKFGSQEFPFNMENTRFYITFNF